MNDDFYFNAHFNADEYPPRFFKTLEYRLSQISTVEPYRQSISNTIRRLNDLNKPVVNYELHRPCLFDKDLFFDVMLNHNWETPYGFVLKSLYFNLVDEPGIESFNAKINYPFHTYSELKKGIESSDLFSSGAYSLNDEMKKLIQELYPDPSRWEA